MRFSDVNSGLVGPTQSPRSQNGNIMPTGQAEMPADIHPSWIEERARVAINRNVRVAGHLVFQEPIRIDGHFRGEVSSSDLVVISEDGSVGGSIRSPRLVVLGELEGDISASKSVVLGPRSRFKGKIEAGNVTVCEGAYLNGDLRIGSHTQSSRSEHQASRRGLPSASA